MPSINLPDTLPTPNQAGDRLLVTLCTYNESENLRQLIPEIQQFVPRAEILVIDDNSPDGTGELAEQIAARDSRVHVLHRPGKLGLGTATLAGMEFALERDFDCLLNLDADFSHHPRHIPALLELMGSVDVAIGSRYVPGGGVVGWGLRRHLMSQGINWYARTLLGLRTRDNSGSYRCYRVAKLRELDLSKFRSRGYAFQEEILYRCSRIGCRFGETPITFEDRRYGTTKINRSEALTALWVILRLGWENLRGTPVRRPSDATP
jgi:dolichol-phosphate mannosyltransferase